MSHSGAASGHSLARYVGGFALAVVLTVIPFALVMTGALPREAMFIVIAVCALAQVLVHLHFFLDISLSRTPRENLLAMAFALVLVFLMVGGTLWIMYGLEYRHGM